MKTSIAINGRNIGSNFPPYIIAEMSANHNGDIENAFKILEMAKACGADAVKIQTYTPDTITINSNNPDFVINEGIWKGQTLYDLYSQAHMPWEWHKLLFERAKEIGITIFSSPFDYTAVDLLEELDAPAYKIASFEAIDLPLIEYVAKTGKPMIISTGMADEQEIAEAIAAARSAGCKDLVVLHCVSAYPAPAKEYNLATMVDIQDRFDVLTGLSDHTIDNTVAIASVVMGATVIEKHVTLDRNGGGPDDSFSLEEKELRELCHHSKVAWTACGKVNYERKDSEKENTVFRRSLYVVKDLAKGEIISHEHVRSIRPGFGLKPKYLNQIIGCRAAQSIKKGTPMSFELINKNS